MSDKNTSSIAERMQELRQLVEWFESDEFTLEAAEAKFTQATLLAKAIENDVAKLKNQVTVIKEKFDT